MTKAETLKAQVIDLLTYLLNDKEADITSGIEEGIYQAEDNVNTLNAIEEGKQLVEQFKGYKPAIYIYVDGGNIQGASATEHLSFNL
jgi:hypothetical protein